MFITFEGGEGSGKSWQTRALQRCFHHLCMPSLLLHEPGGTPLGIKLSYLLKWGRSNEISPLSELMLFNASRAQLVNTVIKPALAEGKIILCDRFTDSTVAYQGYGRGLDIEVVKKANYIATGGLLPDLTIVLDIPAKEGLARKNARETNRFEREEIAFHEKVRRGFLTLVDAEPQRFFVIDARLDKQRIFTIIWQRVTRLMR